MNTAWRILGLSLALVGLARAAEPPSTPAKIDFATQVQPIFVEHCYQCHGPDKQESGLRLDAREAAIRGGDSGPLVVAGQSKASELVRRISSTDDDERMPPPAAKTKSLSAAQVETIAAWVDQGAVWPEGKSGSTHWSFQPIRRPSPPGVKDTGWVRNPIDQFVLSRLEQRGLAPTPEADRPTLIKRLSYDLVGLPPRVEDVDAFVADQSGDAYQRLVEGLLESPHFGERWGRHWLDMARYADSDGYEKDNSRPDAWRYRDWVIEAINADMPLDQFAIRQLAGDLLEGATPDDRLATAFHRQTLTNTEGGVDQEQFRVEAIFDRVATTGSVWLGLTVGCAQCHSHKYDPISHEEYYRLFAFFNNGDEVESEVPLSGEALVKFTREQQDAQRKLAELKPKFEKKRAELAAALPAWESELKSTPSSPLAFHPVELIGIESSADTEFKLLSDGSYLATGKSPDVDKVTVTARTDLTDISGFRLETLTHDSLGNRGPGRSDSGNFVLSEFRVFAGANREISDQERVTLKQAAADFSQDNYPVRAAIDAKAKSGWAIAPQTGNDHWAMFVVKRPIDGQATPWLKLALVQNQGSQHTIGRFRVLAITGNDPLLGVPQSVRDVLAIAPDRRTAEQTSALLDYSISQDSNAKELAEQVAKYERQAAARPMMKVRVIAERADKPRTSHVLHRGDFLQPEAEVQPGTLSVLHPLRARGATPDRLDLARWLVDPANSLTPRVLTNHLWSNLFGRGLVRTPGDFGVRGQRPTHPELLDWLAGEWSRRGWSRKEMIRLIVSSATYRQASKTRSEAVEADPLNELWHRQNRFRVEAEVVRDLALSVGGLLWERIGGPSVFPPLPPGIAELSYAGNFKWNASTGEDRYRRGMYTYFKRTAPHPTLTAFDCPDSNTTSLQRQTSNTPLQALTTLNNQAFIEAAQSMARRLLDRGSMSDAERISLAVRWCVARAASDEEVKTFGELLADNRQWYAAHAGEAAAAVGEFQPSGVAPVEAAAWVATTRMVLNLDEFLTRE